VLRRFSFALRPGWVLFHLFVAAAVVTMILLGRWQLRVSEDKNFSIQNFGYAIQWWLFSAFALFVWWRVLRDRVARAGVVSSQAADATSAEPEPTADEPVAYRRYVMPTAAKSDDPVLSAYNDYLARLNAQDAEETT
jgi:DNA-binding transcriptional regulator of glucitol operon